MTSTPALNTVTGHAGLIAIDKIGNKVLFLDPITYRPLRALDGFTPRVHELAISPDRRLAYVPIYGDGKHGDNPHPGHELAVIDLHARRHVRTLSVAPFKAPHCLRWGPQGQLYCLCENSGVVLEMDAESGRILHAIETGSSNAHRMELLPDGSKLYTENEEDAFVSVIDLRARRRIKDIELAGPLDGIGLSPSGDTLVLVSDALPQLFVVDTRTDQVTRTIDLQGYRKPAQIARFSPDGRYLVVTSHEEPLATVLPASLDGQQPVHLQKGPMDMAFHEDGRTVLIANHDAGSISVVDLASGQVVRTLACGKGVETLSFY